MAKRNSDDSFSSSLIKNIKRDKYLLLLVLPVVAYYIIFGYVPMYGLLIAFKDYSARLGVFGSPWNHFQSFIDLFNSAYFFRILKNTLLISIYGLIWAFPVPIVFALILNECRDGLFKKVTQTISYLPHFISTVIIVSMMMNFLSPNDGFVNNIVKSLGHAPINFFARPEWFRTLFIGSGIWQNFGFGAIIYLAAISAIDAQIYEAAIIDGASRWRRMLHVTLPGIFPTILILFVLNLGNLMSVNYTKVILMYNPATYETADVISSYVYRTGIVKSDFSYGAAVGLFNSVINLILLITANKGSKKITKLSLW